MVFLSLEDETGMANVICLPPVWERHRRLAIDASALLVYGRVERMDGAVQPARYPAAAAPVRGRLAAAATSAEQDPPTGGQAVIRRHPGRHPGRQPLPPLQPIMIMGWLLQER